MAHMMQRDEELAKKIQVLKQKLDEVEQLARGRGLGGFSHFKHGHATEGLQNPDNGRELNTLYKGFN
ncbi:hypothetical protein NC651_001027 [Populus alba x Populus x berolinensis]|nr:hypothetical protein NC651_001027 [Populus alba x Populus x berolinensis]